jgi:hypothetical protein
MDFRGCLFSIFSDACMLIIKKALKIAHIGKNGHLKKNLKIWITRFVTEDAKFFGRISLDKRYLISLSRVFFCLERKVPFILLLISNHVLYDLQYM